MMKRFEKEKADIMLSDCDILEGKPVDWETQTKPLNNWGQNCKRRTQRICELLDEINLSSEQRNGYRMRLERCSKPTTQEKRVAKACGRLKRHTSKPHEEYEEVRLDRLQGKEDGADEPLQDAVAAVRKVWKPILDALAAQPSSHNETASSAVGDTSTSEDTSSLGNRNKQEERVGKAEEDEEDWKAMQPIIDFLYGTKDDHE